MMALFMKQDFTPPVLSRRWIAIKLRPNMLIYSRDHIISILESGLLFREDCVEVEQEAPSEQEVWRAAGGGRVGWMTRGEQVGAGALVIACLVACPPKNLQRSTLLRTAAYMLLPLGVRLAHRRRCRGFLHALLACMRDYLTLARRAAAMCREYAALHAKLGSLSSVLESMHTMLCRQQSELAVLMSRASSAILGNAPWLRDDVAWDAVSRDNSENLMKIHHAFLVVQSTLLKHIAMAHYLPPAHAQKIYKNHNERIYWIHTVLIKHLTEEFKENYAALERMYRLLKNYGTKDSEPKKPGHAVKDNWLYSDVHTDIARTNLELKLALTKCSSIDMFLDACALNKQELNVDILNKDIEDLIDNLTKCLSTAQNSQIRLKKLHRKFEDDDTKMKDKDVVLNAEEKTNILKIEDKEPETRDEVFYYVKTEEDAPPQSAEDITTGPGKREKDATKVVLNELKRKLVKREDVMRERERQALAKTMPELKVVPEFPRQINVEVLDRKGFISKIRINTKNKNLKAQLKKGIHKRKCFSCKRNKMFNRVKKYKLEIDYYSNENDIPGYVCEVNSNLKYKSVFITVNELDSVVVVTKWLLKQTDKLESNKVIHANPAESPKEVSYSNSELNGRLDEHLKVSRKDLELSSSESDSEFDQVKRREILKDLRRHRVNRKRNERSIDTEVDESLRPIEYSLGTGLAMASVLQINSIANRPNMVEEQFIGDGEVSDDSGNEISN
ncbi:unnamed protein product [Parnassius apollo]|uniref:(apollo) hypothetical protein n=1 Tax=Parnassius apollo TaxID=110799 RepID=A0A8S3XX43_PARAO|nr:unnamed protein product [Parnassius apollo]